jgi:Glycosyl transferases group 1
VRRVLFLRNFGRETGGNTKVRDYFLHAASHPDLDARIAFSPASRPRASELWDAVPDERIVRDPDLTAFDVVFVNGKDWRLLPDAPGPARIVHFVQHAGYVTEPELLGYLRRPAHRICTTEAIRNAVAPHAAGPLEVIPLGIEDALFAGPARTRPGTVAIWGRKQPAVAAALHRLLARRGIEARLVPGGWLPRARMVAILAETDILVTLPNRIEGFYLPPLEGMASGCAVVCSDAGGNREHCVDGVTTIAPPYGDAAGHADAVARLLGDRDLHSRLREAGMRIASAHRMDAERARVRAFFSRV